MRVKYNWESGTSVGHVILTGKSVRINRNRHVEYICKCGKIGWTRLLHLMSGATTSCGCEASRQTRIRETTHGMCGTRLYNIYRGMIQRCYDKNCESYKYYGKKGVTVCDEWRNNFTAFYKWATLNGYKEGLEIDKDKLSPLKTGVIYSPTFCCFITRKENLRNTGQCRVIEYNGKIQNLSAWCEELGINYKLVHSRINERGWGVKRAFETPVFINLSHKKIKNVVAI